MKEIDIKFAVIGLNHGYKFAQDIQEINGVTLAAVAGNDQLAKTRAEELQVPLFTDYKELIEQCDLDGVIITLPNHLHKEAVQFCANKGIPTLIEKPIASSIADGKDIVKAAHEANIPLLVGHHRRFSNKVKKLKEIIDSGVIGDLIGVHMMFALAKDHDYFTQSWRVTKGGGPILINAAHDIDTVRFITGLTIDQVYASSQNRIRNNEVEDAASILLETKEGPTITYFVSDGTPSPWSYELTVGENKKYVQHQNDAYYFLGTKGSIAFPSMTLYSYDETGYGWEHALNVKNFEVEENDPLTTELLHFIDIIKGEAEPFVTGEDALKTLKVVLAIKQSAEEKKLVSLLHEDFNT